MASNKGKMKGPWTAGRIIKGSLAVLVLVSGFLLYLNFNRMLSEALLRVFNSHVISDVYELNFRNLRVNIFEGNISVLNVSLQPREKPLKDYPYINSSFKLNANELKLEHVAILDLLRSSTLNLEKISITRPEIDANLAGIRNIVFPFSDSVGATNENKKKTINHFLLQSFQLIDARIQTRNVGRKREFLIERFSITLDNLLISQRPGEDNVSLQHGKVAIGSFDGRTGKEPVRHTRFTDLAMGIDSLNIHNSVDTAIYNFYGGRLAIHNLDVQTRDSAYHVAMKSFDLSYRENSIGITGLKLQPNFTFESMQRKFKYVHTDFSGSVGALAIRNISFDSLIRAKKLFIDEVALDSVEFTLFADLTKPRDPAKRPPFLGQVIASIKMPLLVKQVKATHVHLVNRERKKDSTLAEVHLTNATAQLINVTNISRRLPLVLSAEALLAGKTHFRAALTFDYHKPEFKFEGLLKRFDLPDMNPIIEAYTPGKIKTGVADEISFAGLATAVQSTGTMKFLYHDLSVDVNLKKGKWASGILAFTANTAVHESNPKSNNLPPRVVTFKVSTDPNKGFIGLLIKSLLNGIKETMFMSKENKKAYKEAKKKAQK